VAVFVGSVKEYSAYDSVATVVVATLSACIMDMVIPVIGVMGSSVAGTEE
jgi:hypothetical protein